MKTVYRCENCSNRVVIRSAGFITHEEGHCIILDNYVDIDDGCTFGDDLGPSDGIEPYDVDLSSTYFPHEEF